MRSDLNVESDGAAGQTGPGDLQTELPDTAVLHLQGQLQHGQTVGAELEVDEEDVAVQSPTAQVVQVQVLHYLPQVGVDDVGQERVEHPDLLT